MHPSEGVSFVQTADGAQTVECKDGTYTVTSPIGYNEDNKKAVLADVGSKLVVQEKNTWKTGSESLGNLFQTFWQSKQTEDGTYTAEALEKAFYERYQSQLPNYLTPGLFYGDASDPQNATKTAVRDRAIVKLQKNVPQRIRMFIWLEGQDVDCVREAAMERFALGLEFAGSTDEE
jgi:hypothetical protein